MEANVFHISHDYFLHNTPSISFCSSPICQILQSNVAHYSNTPSPPSVLESCCPCQPTWRAEGCCAPKSCVRTTLCRGAQWSCCWTLRVATPKLWAVISLLHQPPADTRALIDLQTTVLSPSCRSWTARSSQAWGRRRPQPSPPRLVSEVSSKCRRWSDAAVNTARLWFLSLVVQLLMRPDAEVLAILGSGNQAVSHYNVFTEMFSFKEVKTPAWTGDSLIDTLCIFSPYPALIYCKSTIFISNFVIYWGTVTWV